MTEDITVEAEATEEANFEVEPEEDAPKKEDCGAQKRIRQLVRQRNEAREAAAQIASEADALRNQVGNLMHHSKNAETAREKIAKRNKIGNVFDRKLQWNFF